MDNDLEQEAKTSNNPVVMTKNELLGLMDKVQEETIATALLTIERSEQFSGPVPHPDHMMRYQEIDETLPNRFTAMAESNLQHKQSIEKIKVVGELLMGVLGWATPTGIGFYALFEATALIREGKSIEAFVALVTAIGALGTAFYIKNKDTDKSN